MPTGVFFSLSGKNITATFNPPVNIATNPVTSYKLECNVGGSIESITGTISPLTLHASYNCSTYLNPFGCEETVSCKIYSYSGSIASAPVNSVPFFIHYP